MFVYDDGGRKDAGFKGTTGDCGVRAIAIATGIPYKQVYDKINELAKTDPKSKRRRTTSNARTGVYRITIERFFKEIGWEWVPGMKFGQGCRIHVKADELPDDRLVLRLSRHFAAFIHGDLHDIYDCSRDGTRCVYGFWRKKR